MNVRLVRIRSVLCLILISVTAPAFCRGDDRLQTTDRKPPSTPPFAVGSITMFFRDETRSFDAFNGIHSGVRVLPTEIWYPIRLKEPPSGRRRATYGDYVFGNRAMHRIMAADAGLAAGAVREDVSQRQIDDTIEMLFAEARNSCADAALSDAGAPFPVVIMSHGDRGQRLNMESAAEFLAAHGYIVLAPDHPGNATFAQTGQDPALRTDPEYAARMKDVIALCDEHGAYYSPPKTRGKGLDLNELKRIYALIVQRVNDLRTILNALPELNADGRFQDAIDLERTGVMGRSLGAATALAALGLEPRFAAGVAVVAPSVPDFRSLIPQQFLAQPGEESVMFSPDGGFPLARFTRPTFVINSDEDALIIGMNKALAAAFGSPVPSPANRHPVLRSAFEACVHPVVWTDIKNGHHETMQAAAAYWRPSLKPNRFPRVFAPDTQFTEMPPRRAHAFQAESVTAFFELIFRHDARALQSLKNRGDGPHTISIDSRNLKMTSSARVN